MVDHHPVVDAQYCAALGQMAVVQDGHVVEIGNWLGLEISQDRAAEVVEQCSLDRMRAAELEAMRSTPHVVPRPARNTGISLLGAGAVQGWRQVLTPQQQTRFGRFNRGLSQMGYESA